MLRRSFLAMTARRPGWATGRRKTPRAIGIILFVHPHLTRFQLNSHHRGPRGVVPCWAVVVSFPSIDIKQLSVPSCTPGPQDTYMSSRSSGHSPRVSSL